MASSNSIVPPIEIEVYAPGLRDGDGILQLTHQLDLLPGVRHKIDSLHEIVYFESDDASKISQQQIVDLFDAIGIPMRFVGDVSDVIPVSSEETCLETED